MFTIEVVGRVLPFKASSYVIDELIDWGPLRAYQQVSGACRTVRVPSVSSGPGKIRIVGVSEINGEKVFVLNFIQGRNPDWTNRPFFARYDPDAIWISDLKPAFGEEAFFFEEELVSMSD
ncbi:hypothetical protein SD074_22280 [Prolixibacter sp. SD074]|nr:hypothetical protein SD074_22280 [Prolixibacter sp. SD074]